MAKKMKPMKTLDQMKRESAESDRKRNRKPGDPPTLEQMKADAEKPSATRRRRS